MVSQSSFRATLKRGVLVAVANWPVVLIQFAAESLFTLLLAVPVVGGASIVALVLGPPDVDRLLRGEMADVVVGYADALREYPLALAGLVWAFAVVVVGGSALTFLIKGGTVAVLVEAERVAGPIERPPLRLQALQRAACFSIEAFLEGCRRYYRRYLRLGFSLLGVYGASALIYLTILFYSSRVLASWPVALGWPLILAGSSSALVVWITGVNLVYLLVQIAVAVEDCGVRRAARRTARFLHDRYREISVIFVWVLGLVVVTLAASILATVGLGLISFVPLVGLTVLPLQAAAWLLRGLVFQLLGLTALTAYVVLYRPFAEEDTRAAGDSSTLRSVS